MASQRDAILQKSAEYFSKIPGAEVFPSQDSDRPDLVVLLPGRGIVMLDGVIDGVDILETRKSLNRKVAKLRATLDLGDEQRMTRIVVLGEGDTESKVGNATFVCSLDSLISGEIVNQLDESNLADSTVERIRNQYQPFMLFSRNGWVGGQDSGLIERHNLRLRLDGEQATAALTPAEDVLRVTGPPGSGKTLVLAARARWLAENNPTWQIYFVCFNKNLVSYIRQLVGIHQNITVSTFNAFAEFGGHRFGNNDEDIAAAAYDRASRSGITAICDALLIDEYQDFSTSWIKYCLDSLRPGRGGLAVAGDQKQAIYQSNDPFRPLLNRDVVEVELSTPYRSTKQILTFVATLDDEFCTAGAEQAPDGEPVHLICADSWDGQADAAVSEVRQALLRGECQPSDIAVLCTRKSLVRRLQTRFSESHVPFTMEPVLSGGGAKRPEEVTLATIHATKGLEFPFVIVVGIDALEHKISDPDDAKRLRVGYVGPTRASDRLAVTFSKSTSLIERLRPCDESVLRRFNYPDDFEEIP